MELRSNAGTHDVDFGLAAISNLKGCRTADSTVKVPRYDKAAHGGKGTRAAESTWPAITGPVEVILFEGWMLGFEPVRSRLTVAVLACALRHVQICVHFSCSDFVACAEDWQCTRHLLHSITMW